MIEALRTAVQNHRNSIFGFFRLLGAQNRGHLLQSDVNDLFDEYLESAPSGGLERTVFAEMVRRTQEVVIAPSWLCFAVRPRVAQWLFVRFNGDNAEFEEMDTAHFLETKERMVHPEQHEDDWVLELDLRPFNRDFPKLVEARSIGRGVEFLNRVLSNKLFSGNRTVENGNRLLLDFLRVHNYKGQQLMLNNRVESIRELRAAVNRALDHLHGLPPETEWKDVALDMQGFGFEPGWGRTAERVTGTLQLLSDILEAPDPDMFGGFLGRIPMIFNIVILSPHGYFAQANVFGLPDTGGQVVYILDQVKALEREMKERLHQQGLDIDPQILVITRLIPEDRGTTCGQATEPIIGTQHAKIIRVPFRNQHGEIVPHWISRFNIWPFLESFTIETEKEILATLGARPDLIIGNYSDGNLAASLLSRRLGVTQCNIAHALEKSKYLFSDLYWKDQDEHYHFSCQFTADLIAMNTADFIIASTYQEIAGDANNVGQYESYGFFTMPGLYRVVSGIDIYDPKFNIVSPGADPVIFFPYTRTNDRPLGLREDIEDLLFGEAGETRRGRWDDPDKPILFTMARFDKIKNLTGFTKWYAECPELREAANLLVIGGRIDAGQSQDGEEREQVEYMHHLMNEHHLDGQVRWLGIHLRKNISGELYRYIADRRGAFVQPALFEAFGLTVVEAMASGLPVFVTKYGGPSEIVRDGVSGFHIDPNHGGEAAMKMAEFLERCKENPGHWETLSNGAIQRVNERYNWKLYAERLMTLSRIYGFWKYVSDLEREETRRYLEMVYGLIFRGLAGQMNHQ